MKFTKKTTKIKFTNKKITFIANRHPSADVIFYTEPSAAEIIDATVETIKEYNSEFSKPGEPNAYVTKYKIYNFPNKSTIVFRVRKEHKLLKAKKIVSNLGNKIRMARF